MAIQNNMSFVSTVQDYINFNPNASLKEIHEFWNKIQIIKRKRPNKSDESK